MEDLARRFEDELRLQMKEKESVAPADTEMSIAAPPTYVIAARIYLAFVIIIGSVGNLICLAIYYRSRLLKRFRSTAYLKALAISDLWFLLCLGLIWLKGVDVHWHDYPIVCPLSIYLSNTSSFLSAWYVMAMTTEMAATVRRARFRSATGGRIKLIIAAGHGEQTISTVSRLVFIAALGLLANGWTLAVTESVKHIDPIQAMKINSTPHWTYECRIAIESENLYRIFNILDTAFSFTIPLAVTVLLNIYIVYTIITAARFRKAPIREESKTSRQTGKKGSLSTTTMTTVIAGNHFAKAPRRVSWRPSRKETTMASLLAARSIAYIVLNLPNYVHRLHATLENSVASSADPHQTYSDVSTPTTIDDQATSEASWQIFVYLLFYTQYALNFFIYSGRICLRSAIKRAL